VLRTQRDEARREAGGAASPPSPTPLGTLGGKFPGHSGGGRSVRGRATQPARGLTGGGNGCLARQHMHMRAKLAGFGLPLHNLASAFTVIVCLGISFTPLLSMGIGDRGWGWSAHVRVWAGGSALAPAWEAPSVAPPGPCLGLLVVGEVPVQRHRPEARLDGLAGHVLLAELGWATERGQGKRGSEMNPKLHHQAWAGFLVELSFLPPTPAPPPPRPCMLSAHWVALCSCVCTTVSPHTLR
jgi:hypothetical protein